MLNEESKRKPNWSERNSAPVVLADGQSWWIPKPWLEIRPVFRRGRAVSAYPVPTQGPELDELVDAMAECEDRSGQVMAAASLAAHLLSWHYELTDSELDGLLCFRKGDDASLEWMKQVCDIAMGASGPKVFCAGGD